jgi:hypothetical protein
MGAPAVNAVLDREMDMGVSGDIGALVGVMPGFVGLQDASIQMSKVKNTLFINLLIGLGVKKTEKVKPSAGITFPVSAKRPVIGPL